jgi:hypothetical protein
MQRSILTAAVAALLLACEGGPVARDSAEMPTASTGSAANRGDGAGGSAGPVGSIDGALSKEREEAVRLRQQSVSEAPAAPPAAPMPQADRASAQPAATATAAQSMLIRTGHATLEVQALDAAMARVRTMAQQLGGFVANTSVVGGRDQVRSATLELRIPAARFDEAVSGLSPVGKVESVNVMAEDVGEEFVDVSARVANARRLEERLVRLLASQTGRLQDVLAVERELARVREEVERYEGRMRYLQTRVAVSTLVINLHEPFPIIAGAPGANPIVDAFRQAWRNFVGFVAWLIAASGVLLPLLVILLLAWAAWHRWGPDLRPRRRTTPPPAAVD